MLGRVVWLSPTGAVSDSLAKASVALGAAVSSVKPSVASGLRLPAPSTACRRRLCTPSARLPPASASSWLRLTVTVPPARLPLSAVKLAPSSAASTVVTPVLSSASASTVTVLVMRSTAELPVSACRRRLPRLGGLVSGSGTRTRLRLPDWLLPARSVTSRLMLLLPMASATPVRSNRPSAPALAVRPWAGRSMRAPASVTPVRVTAAAVVRPSSPPSAWAAVMPKPAAGAVVSRVSAMSWLLRWPAASCATTRTLCAPSARLPPASASSWARLMRKLPPGCRLAIRLVKAGLSPCGSRATSNSVTPTSSVAVPAMAASWVTPSSALAPVSLASAACSVGARVSGANSRTNTRLAWVALPAASRRLSSKLLLPRASAMPARLRLPSPATWPLASGSACPARRSV